MKELLVWNFEISNTQEIEWPSSQLNSDECKWEIRQFWEKNNIITLNHLPKECINIANFKYKQNTDIYAIHPKHNKNIKKRKNKWSYKPVLKKQNNAIGFDKKIKLSDIECKKNLKDAKLVTVSKERFIYKFPTNPKLELELARVKINNNYYFSLSVESKSLLFAKTLYEKLQSNQNSCDYITFIKKIIEPK